MSDDFDAVFGNQPGYRPITFTERVSRPETTTPPPAAEVMTGSEPYKAFGFLPAGNVVETCDVRRWIDGTNIAEGIEFQYRFLMQVGYVGDEQLRLLLPHCLSLIEGVMLAPLRSKLARRQVTFIQQMNRAIWKCDDSLTKIDRITISMSDS